jgi:ribonuclease HII
VASRNVTRAASNGMRPIDHYERQLHAEGFRLVAGVDEAGRGALAGPLVAAAVILPLGFDIEGLADSKQLTPQQRDEWFDRIRPRAVSVAVCRSFPRRIDSRGLHVSNLRLLRLAIKALDVRPDFVLTDGFPLPGVPLPHLSIKKGDEVTASVAAASVVAKVTRDRTMDRYHRRYPQYGFDHHRGYGTPSHRAAIARYGPCPIHRMSFKGMGLYMEDRETYLRLYGRDLPETVEAEPDDGDLPESIEVGEEPEVVDLEELGGPGGR